MPVSTTVAGFVPLEADWWAGIVAALPEGVPWPREAALMDLRVMQDQHSTLPDHAVLARRWNWYSQKSGQPSVKRVRLLKASEEWVDAYTGKGRARAGQGQARGRARAGQGQANNRPTPNISTAGTGEGQARGRPGAGQGQGKGHTRREIVHPTPSPSPSSSAKKDPKPEQQLIGWDRVVATYQGEVREKQGFTRRAPTTSKHLTILKSLVKAHGSPEVLAVMQWLMTSDHPSARACREGAYGPETWRRHWEKYSEQATARRAPTTSSASLDEAWAAAVARLGRERHPPPDLPAAALRAFRNDPSLWREMGQSNDFQLRALKARFEQRATS